MEQGRGGEPQDEGCERRVVFRELGADDAGLEALRGGVRMGPFDHSYPELMALEETHPPPGSPLSLAEPRQ